jgi:HK97 family phage prohead protease
MKQIYDYKDFSEGAMISDVDTKKGIVSGYFSKFDNIDSDGDIIRKGAFSKTIQENGPQSMRPRIKHLQNHDITQPLGLIVSLQEDNYGLAYESKIGSHTLGQDFIKMIESGLITEHSIGYKVIKGTKMKDGGSDIVEIKLWEGSSLTAWGANSLTPITGLKSLSDIDHLVNRQKALEKFCKNSTASDETIELLLIECKQLTQYIINNNATKSAEEVTPPDLVNVYAEGINNFYNKLIN